jgi:hypothetical protein
MSDAEVTLDGWTTYGTKEMKGRYQKTAEETLDNGRIRMDSPVPPTWCQTWRRPL